MENGRTIFVDLDGTLVRTDLFWEGLLAVVKHYPWRIPRLVYWLCRGREKAKAFVARLVGFDPTILPYEGELLDYLRERKAAGDRLVLATASHRRLARAVARHLGLFDDVIATTGRRNLKSRAKLASIRDSMGGGSFVYAGDSVADRPIWEAASASILVNASTADVDRQRQAGKLEKLVQTRNSRLRPFVRTMRPHQWAKNVLIFVPLLASHLYGSEGAVLQAMLGFVAFSLCASGVYFLNDLLDLDADRRHRSKQHRPLACGDLTIPLGLMGAAILPLAAFALSALFLPWPFVLCLLGYYLLTNSYSFFLKRISTADVMTLALLYTMRIVAGALAIDVVLSSWLLAFSMFAFVSLAYLKRYIEIAALGDGADNVHGRGYSAADSETMFVLGSASMIASVVVLSLYVNTQEGEAGYRSPYVLWLLCLLVLYWGNRIWIGARRGKITEDPVIFAVKDKVSRLVAICFIGVVIAAKYAG